MPEFTEQEIQVLVDEFREANVLPQYWSYAFELLAADKTHPVDARVHNVLTEIRGEARFQLAWKLEETSGTKEEWLESLRNSLIVIGTF